MRAILRRDRLIGFVNRHAVLVLTLLVNLLIIMGVIVIIPDTEREWVPVRNKCQFSWYCDGKADDIPNINDNYKWQMAQEIANDILELDRWSGIIDGATHYHANYVNPKWSSSLHYVGRVDDHLFYRWD